MRFSLKQESPYFSCGENVNRKGGDFLKKINKMEYIEKRRNNIPVIRTKHTYWVIGKKPKVKYTE